MASLSIRKLEDDIYRNLRIRAATHGVSMEEEARRILKAAILPPEPISQVFRKRFGDTQGVELELPTHKPHEPLDLA